MPSSETRPQLGRGKILGFVGVSLLILFGLSLLLDRALGLLGFPGEVAVGPPPNFEAEIENLEFRYTLRTNDRGIRYRTIPLEKPDGVRRVVLLGDSATEAMGVSDEQRWSDRVERLFEQDGRRVEMVNCAETGTSPFNYGQKLFHICLDYQPDVVVIAMHMNDLPSMKLDLEPAQMLPGSHVRRTTPFRTLLYRLWPHVYTLYRDSVIYGEERRERSDIVSAVRAEARRRGLPESQVDGWREMIPDDLLEAANQGRVNPALLTYSLMRPDGIRASLDLASDTARAKFAALGRVLGFIREHCEARGIEVGLVLTPSPYQYDPKSPDRLQAQLYAAAGFPMRPEWLLEPTVLERELERWAAGQDIPFLNLAQAFREAVRESDRPLNWEFDNHMTPYGHAVAADAVHLWLQDLRTIAAGARPS